MKVSPACAGMIPRRIFEHAKSPCEPRMRGDDPRPRPPKSGMDA